jgi:hypothetical protein
VDNAFLALPSIYALVLVLLLPLFTLVKSKENAEYVPAGVGSLAQSDGWMPNHVVNHNQPMPVVVEPSTKQ